MKTLKRGEAPDGMDIEVNANSVEKQKILAEFVSKVGTAVYYINYIIYSILYI